MASGLFLSCVPFLLGWAVQFAEWSSQIRWDLQRCLPNAPGVQQSLIQPDRTTSPSPRAVQLPASQQLFCPLSFTPHMHRLLCRKRLEETPEQMSSIFPPCSSLSSILSLEIPTALASSTLSQLGKAAGLCLGFSSLL